MESGRAGKQCSHTVYKEKTMESPIAVPPTTGFLSNSVYQWVEQLAFKIKNWREIWCLSLSYRTSLWKSSVCSSSRITWPTIFALVGRSCIKSLHICIKGFSTLFHQQCPDQEPTIAVVHVTRSCQGLTLGVFNGVTVICFIWWPQ